MTVAITLQEPGKAPAATSAVAMRSQGEKGRGWCNGGGNVWVWNNYRDGDSFGNRGGGWCYGERGDNLDRRDYLGGCLGYGFGSGGLNGNGGNDLVQDGVLDLGLGGCRESVGFRYGDLRRYLVDYFAVIQEVYLVCYLLGVQDRDLSREGVDYGLGFGRCPQDC